MKRLIICLLALLMVAGCAPAADVDITTELIEEVPPEPLPTVEIDGGYVLIFSNDDSTYNAACKFMKLYAKATGITLKLKKDAMVEKSESAKEIVFGKTDRDNFYTINYDALVSDAFVLSLQGERLYIAAGTVEGYVAAFAEFFKQTIGIEDIEMITQTDNKISLPEGFEKIAEPSIQLESDKTASGISYRVEGAQSGAYNHYIFEESLTYWFDTPIGEKFNGYKVVYSTDNYLRGEITYLYSGEKYSEEFYLEPGENMSFYSLCDKALGGKNADSISSVKFSVIKGKSASILLEDITVSSKAMPDSDIVYITDGKYKLGVKLSWGGGVSYLEDLADGDESITNLLNDHDTGRLIQQSYYGTASAPYVPAKYGDTLWSYNPVQGGDQYGNKSKLVDFKIAEDGKSVYIKCQPLDWAQKNSRTPSYMENKYSIENGYIKVDNRFFDFSGYTHVNSHQELPAFYTISYLSDFVFYNGTDAWKGELTVKKDLPFWAGNSDAYFSMTSKETWGAWVAPNGYGVGVYTPIAEILLAGRHQYNGSKDANNNATNYVAPLITYKMKTFEAFEYSYYITTGSVEQIRETFKNVK